MKLRDALGSSVFFRLPDRGMRKFLCHTGLGSVYSFFPGRPDRRSHRELVR